MSNTYVNDVGGKLKVALKDDGGKTAAHLLWGDAVRILKEQGDQVEVEARHRKGWVPRSALGDEGLSFATIESGRP